MQNFVKNSFNVRDQRTLSELWEAFSGATNTKQVYSVDIVVTMDTIINTFMWFGITLSITPHIKPNPNPNPNPMLLATVHMCN